MVVKFLRGTQWNGIVYEAGEIAEVSAADAHWLTTRGKAEISDAPIDRSVGLKTSGVELPQTRVFKKTQSVKKVSNGD
jgi:hypothetical protein